MVSLRKHFTQLTEVEKDFLKKRLNKTLDWKLSSYLLRRIEERGGNYESIMEVLNAGHIIEYHQKDGMNRVLLRGTKVYHKWVLCVVYQFSDKKVITAYWNSVNDHHRTLKEEIYDKDLDVIRLFEEEKERSLL